MALEKPSHLGQNASKIRPIIAILFTSLTSIFLIVEHEQKFVGSFRDLVMQNPGTSSFVKQLVASLLGTLWVYVAGSIFNLTTRLRFASDRKPKLQTLNLWAALGVQRIDFNLPVFYLFITTVVLLAGHGIGAVWGGAIAPITTTLNFCNNISVPVPVFIERPPWMTQEFPEIGDPGKFDDSVATCRTSNGQSGFVPTCPVPSLQNLIISSANLASTLNGEPRLHSKNDNPSWSYIGRSYGAGSSLGLTEITDYIDRSYGPGSSLGLTELTELTNHTSHGEVLGYIYNETGYMAQSNCRFNMTTQFYIGAEPISVEPPGSNLALQIYSASGSTPASPYNWSFPIILTNQSSADGILTWAGSSNETHGILSLAACGIYEAYDRFQCDVTWTPTLFNVTVNIVNKTILVQPLNSLQNAIGFDDNAYLRTNTMASLSILAQTSFSSSYATLGQSLLGNWATYNESLAYKAQGSSFNGNIIYGVNGTELGDHSPASALQDSLDAMLDDIIVGFGAASLGWEFNGNGTGNAAIEAQYSAVKFGENRYIYATLAINIILFVIAIEEVIRTRNWKDISLFDYQDLKSVIMATSAGGTGIADECRSRHLEGTSWDGDAASKEVAEMRVKLVVSRHEKGAEEGEGEVDRGPAIVFAGTSEVNGYHVDNETVPLKH